MSNYKITDKDLVYSRALKVLLEDETLVTRYLSLDDMANVFNTLNWAKGLHEQLVKANQQKPEVPKPSEGKPKKIGAKKVGSNK